MHLVQFHWWDFSKGDFLKVGRYLQELKNDGIIEEIGVTNFDCEHLKLMIDGGIDVSSNQIQFSMLDPRPLNGMLEFSKKNNIAIFCYGTLAGGLLAQPALQIDPQNRSHRKYALMIEEAGMSHYGAVSDVIGQMADKYKTSRSVIATAFVLNTDGVTSAIIGPRNANYIEEAKVASELLLEPEDMQKMTELLIKSKVQGDIYSYERQVGSMHGRIMRYNLNHMRDKEQ